MAWQTASKTVVQNFELNAVVVSPWQTFLAEVADADWNRLAGSNGTRIAEHAYELARNAIETNYQFSVAGARTELRHDRAVAEVAKAGIELQTQLSEARAEFNQRESLTQPTRLEYSAGFGEEAARFLGKRQRGFRSEAIAELVRVQIFRTKLKSDDFSY